MAPPKNSSKDDDLPSDGRDDDTNPMATGTYKAQVTTMPDANTFRSLIPETAGGGNASSGASSTQKQFTKRPLLELHEVEVNVMKVRQDMDANNAVVSRDKLEDESIVFKGLLILFIFSTMKLTGLLASNPASASDPKVQSEVKLMEAIATFLEERMGLIPGVDDGTPEEQARRNKIRMGYQRGIDEIKKRLATERDQPGS